MMTGLVLDGCGGPGGWELGARRLGIDPVGVEIDADTCATRAAAGLRTLRADVTVMPLEHLAGRVWGLCFSPPCVAFSKAGNREGAAFVDLLVRAVHDEDWAARPSPDPLVWLVLEVGRWATTLEPEWIACEQVPEVAPLWRAYAQVLERHGYSAWAGIVTAEQYGVPQTRERALLLASRARAVGAPPATHERYVKREQGLATLGLLRPWVSMAEALGWTEPVAVGFPRRDDRGDSLDGYRERDWRSGDEPSFAVTEKARSWMLHTNRGQDESGVRQTRETSAPAPALTAKSGGQWQWRRNDQGVDGGAPGGDDLDWPLHRPATTIAGRGLAPDPGANANRFNGASKSRNDGYRLEISEALILQSFPADYPLQGTRTSQHRQAGNAIPPLLAAHALAAVLGVDAPA